MQNIDINNLAILLIEPSAMQRKVIRRRLEKFGIQNLEEAEGVAEALEKCESFGPDLVCSAYYFEDGTATDIVQGINNLETMNDSLFMLVSSEYRGNELEIIRQSGVIAILPKPFTGEQLKSALDSTFSLLNPQEINIDGVYGEDLSVLIVDDSDTARKHLKRVFQNCGVEQIQLACNGEEAIHLVEENEFDLVVTDLNMPVMDGKELTEFIRNFSNQQDVPILMVTSEQNDSKLQAVQNSGINSLCDKPFDPTTVKQLIHSLLSNYD